MNRRSFFSFWLSASAASVGGVATVHATTLPAGAPSSEGLWVARIRKLPAPHNQAIDDKHLIHIIRDGDDVRCDIHEIWTRCI